MRDVDIRVANAPCSWGVLELDGASERLSGFASVLDEMADAGYVGTELGDWGFMPTDAAELRRELEARSLAMVGAFVPAALADEAVVEPAITVALRTARLLASVESDSSPFIVLSDENGGDPERTRQAGRITADLSFDDERWSRFADGANSLARRVREETGLRTVFHHHCAGFVETPQEIETLLRLTDPELIGLCLDTGHFTYGGGHPLEFLREQKHRIWHVHFKDCSAEVAASARRDELDYYEAVRRGVFCELGQGVIDFDGIVTELRRGGYNGWIVVEQDVLPGMGTPLQSARRNRDFLDGLGL